MEQPKNISDFSSRLWRALGATAIVLIALLLLWLSMGVVLLTFAGILLAVMLHGLSSLVSKRTRLPSGASLAVVVLSLLTFFGVITYAAGNSLSEQAMSFKEQFPKLKARVQDLAHKHPTISQLLGAGDSKSKATTEPSAAGAEANPQDPSADETSEFLTTVKSAIPSVASRLGGFFGAATDAIVSFLVVFVVGIYVAASPRVYIEGIVYLVPAGRRHRARETIVAIVYALRGWMLGQSISMAAVFFLTAVGLWLCGLDLWLLFAVFAGLFNFIPNFGALFSFVPAALVAWGDDPHKIIWVTLVYVIAQSLEGYLITPLVQKRVTEVPPALLIVSQVLMGTLGGLLAIMLAAPITVATLVAVKMLYVEDTLGDDVATPDDQPNVQRQVESLEAESKACD